MKKFILVVCSVLAMPSYSAEFQRSEEQQLSQEQINIIVEKFSLFDLLNFASSRNEAQISESELFEFSDVAVTGYIESITAGRTIFDSRQPYPDPIRTSIIKLKVTSILKGSASDNVYIEYTTGGMAPDILNAAKYDGELLVYLVAQDDKYGGQMYDVNNSEKGVMKEVDQLYDLAVSGGLIIIEEDKLSGEIIKRRPLLEAEAKQRSSSDVDQVNPERVLIGPSNPSNARPQ